MTVRILDASEFEDIRAMHVASNYVHDYCFMTRSRLMYATDEELKALGREDLATLAAMMEITKLRLLHALDNEQKTFNLQETKKFYEELHTTRTIVHMRGDCAHIYNIILQLKGLKVLAEVDRTHLNEMASYLFSIHEHLRQIEEVDDES